MRPRFVTTLGASFDHRVVDGDVASRFLADVVLQALNGEGAQLPATPTLTYLGAPTHPVNDLRFASGAFSDPQGAGTFGAIQWRLAEVTDPAAPAYLPGEHFKLEIEASYDSGELAVFNGEFRFPASGARVGHAYRARVRHKDSTGRWSHWSSSLASSAHSVAIEASGPSESS